MVDVYTVLQTIFVVGVPCGPIVQKINKNSNSLWQVLSSCIDFIDFRLWAEQIA